MLKSSQSAISHQQSESVFLLLLLYCPSQQPIYFNCWRNRLKGMADWHVSDSDSGDEYESSLDSSTILTVRIDRDKVLELLKAVEVKKTLELECLSRVVRKEHHKRNGRLHTQPATSPASQPAVDQHNGEEVSESPSLKSAHTASTGGTECRDSRK